MSIFGKKHFPREGASVQGPGDWAELSKGIKKLFREDCQLGGRGTAQ